MKTATKIVLYSLLLFAGQWSWSQQPVIDSLKRVYSARNKIDTATVGLLNRVASELYDVPHTILETVMEPSSSTKLDISIKSNGLYFLKIKTEKGSKVEKIVKE